jgi:hypothetical protein
VGEPERHGLFFKTSVKMASSPVGNGLCSAACLPACRPLVAGCFQPTASGPSPFPPWPPPGPLFRPPVRDASQHRSRALRLLSLASAEFAAAVRAVPAVSRFSAASESATASRRRAVPWPALAGQLGNVDQRPGDALAWDADARFAG